MRSNQAGIYMLGHYNLSYTMYYTFSNNDLTLYSVTDSSYFHVKIELGIEDYLTVCVCGKAGLG